MRLTLFLLYIGVCLFISCNSGENKASAETCYRYEGTNDTISLKVVRNADAVTGTLDYNFKEKDDNRGTIKGNLKGDLLIADYTFTSEGVQSTRQVVFKLKDNFVVEGYGDNTDSLAFNDSMKLVEATCR